MPGPKRRRASAADLPALAEALVAEPRAKANNLPVLLAALTPECSEVRACRRRRCCLPGALAGLVPKMPCCIRRCKHTAQAQCRSMAVTPLLRCRYLDTHLATSPPALQAVPVLHSLRLFFIDSFDRGDLSVMPPEEGVTTAEAVYAAWLHRQYRSYQAALLRLLGGTQPAAEARTQVGRRDSTRPLAAVLWQHHRQAGGWGRADYAASPGAADLRLASRPVQRNAQPRSQSQSL